MSVNLGSMAEILGRTANAGVAGAKLGGPWGAVAGAAVGLVTGIGKDIASNNSKTVYKAQNFISGGNPSSGIIEGMPGASREQSISSYEKEAPSMKFWDTAASAVDLASSMGQAFAKKKVPDPIIPATINKLPYQIPGMDFAFQSRLNNNEVDFDWRTMMKSMKNSMGIKL